MSPATLAWEPCRGAWFLGGGRADQARLKKKIARESRADRIKGTDKPIALDYQRQQ